MLATALFIISSASDSNRHDQEEIINLLISLTLMKQVSLKEIDIRLFLFYTPLLVISLIRLGLILRVSF